MIRTNGHKPVKLTLQVTLYTETKQFLQKKTGTAEVWTWILRIEEKCEFENVTQAEKLASKIFFVNNNIELKNLSVKVNLGKGA